VKFKIAAILLALVTASSAADAQTMGLPVPIPPPTIYSRPEPAPLAPPINPGPAVVPPAGLSPLLTEPGPIYPRAEQSVPAYPAQQYPGPVGEQSMQAYRNGIIEQQWLRDRAGISPSTERSREIQQQLNQTAR
jgi:hypothetical protein